MHYFIISRGELLAEFPELESWIGVDGLAEPITVFLDPNLSDEIMVPMDGLTGFVCAHFGIIEAFKKEQVAPLVYSRTNTWVH